MPLALSGNTQERPLGMRGARFVPCGMPHGPISRICLGAEDHEMRLRTATQMPREVPDAHALRIMPLALPGNTQERPPGMRGARFLLSERVLAADGQFSRCTNMCTPHEKQHA